MALIYANGYELGTTQIPGQTYDTVAADWGTVAGRHGGLGIIVTDTTYRTTIHAISPGSSRVFIGWAQQLSFENWNRTSSPTLSAFISIWQGATQHVSLVADATGHLQLKRGSASGTVIATAADPLPSASAWYWFELEVEIANSGGVANLKIGGLDSTEDGRAISFSGDTQNGGTAGITSFRITGGNAFFGDQIGQDDIVVHDTTGSVDNSWPGEVTIAPLRPDANGASSQLLGSDANSTDNYLLVNEYPTSEANYVASATSGHRDTYGMGAESALAATGSIRAVQQIVRGKTSDGGAASFKHVLRSGGGTVVTSGAVALGASTVSYADSLRTTDADGAPWTHANLAAHEFGAEVA